MREEKKDMNSQKKLVEKITQVFKHACPKIWRLTLNISGKMLSFIGLAGLIPTFAPFLAGTLLLSVTAIAGKTVYDFWKSFQIPAIIDVSANFLGVFPEDELFTDYVTIPEVVLYYPSTNKKYFFDFEKNLPKNEYGGVAKPYGYCISKYNFAFGYKKASDLMKEYKKEVCETGSSDNLPDPSIISSDPIGDPKTYDLGTLDCSQFMSQNNKVNEYARAALDIQAGVLDKFYTRGKESLSALIKTSCPKTVNTRNGASNEN